MSAKPRFTRFTASEHEELGQTISRLRGELIGLHIRVANAYPRTGPEAVAGKKLEAATNAVDQARNALENALFNEHPNDADFQTYRPGSA